jgi:hypothetical protein
MTSGLRTQPHAGGQVAGQPEGDVARMVRLNGAVDRAHRASKAWMSSHPLWGKGLSGGQLEKGDLSTVIVLAIAIVISFDFFQ